MEGQITQELRDSIIAKVNGILDRLNETPEDSLVATFGIGQSFDGKELAGLVMISDGGVVATLYDEAIIPIIEIAATMKRVKEME